MILAADAPLRRFTDDFLKSPLAVIAGIGLVMIILMAVFAGFVAPQNPYNLAEINILDGSLEPGDDGLRGVQILAGQR